MTKARLSFSAPASRSERGIDRLRKPEYTLPFVEETTQHAGAAEEAKVKSDLKKTRKEDHLNLDNSSKVDFGFDRLALCEDPELSMLRSIAGKSSRSYNDTPSRLARLRKHEFEDYSDTESTARNMWKEYDVYARKPRAMSAGAGRSYVRDMESRLAGYRHEKMKSSSSRESHDDRLDGLVYDSDFDCYYNPVTDQYYKLQPNS